ncbi:MAG: F0F1 ATP synthase subunit A [Thermosulfidibacteraceae bacterium]|jgi:F-type H+-transporting ATPase subunit a
MYHPFVINFLGEKYQHVSLFLTVGVILVLIAIFVRSRLSIIPGTVQNILEVFVEGIHDFVSGIIPHEARRHVPLIATAFMFILLSNWIGNVPGFISPTANWNTTIAPAIVVFVYYHVQGIRKHGFIKYLKHFGGPVPFMAPVIFVLETIGHFARVLSLSLRLFGNIMGEETLAVILFSLVPLIIPVPFMFLSIFFGFVQALVFTLLTTVYISLAVEEEHEEHKEHH